MRSPHAEGRHVAHLHQESRALTGTGAVAPARGTGPSRKLPQPCGIPASRRPNAVEKSGSGPFTEDTGSRQWENKTRVQLLINQITLNPSSLYLAICLSSPKSADRQLTTSPLPCQVARTRCRPHWRVPCVPMRARGVQDVMFHPVSTPTNPPQISYMSFGSKSQKMRRKQMTKKGYFEEN